MKAAAAGLGMLVAVAWLAGVAAAPAAAAGEGAERIAVARLEQLLKAHPETAPAETLLEKQREEFEAERRQMVAERDRLREAFERARDEAENPALSEEARVEKLKILETRFKAAREYERELQETQALRQRELNDQGRRLRETIVESIRGTLAAYAQAQGYSLVVNAEDAGMGAFGSVLYHAATIDITEAVEALIRKGGTP